MAIDIMGSSLDKLDFSNLKLPDLSSGIAALQKAYPTKEQTIEYLKNQILSQGTTSKWSGEGFGSPEANAKNMAEILQGIGITDIRQFGQVDKYEPVTQIGYELNGKRVQNPRPGVYYEVVTIDVGDGSYDVRRDLTPQEAAQVKPIYGVVTGYDEYNQPTYNVVDAKNVTTKDGQLVGVTGQTYGNKVTGQVVPNTYSERQTGNAWGGTFAGSGNTGYRVEFAPDGTPYFYTTGASSKDSFFSDIAPILGLGLMFVPGMQGIGASIGSALAPAASAAVQAGIGNAIVQGVMSEATGGDFLKGAALSGIGSLAGGLQPGLSEALGGGAVGDIASKALIGGTMSELSGGDFAQGALISGVGAGIDQAKLSAAEDYLKSIPPGRYYESDLPTLNVYPNDTFGVIDGRFVIDSSFKPDYSLATGATGAPALTVKPLDTQYTVGSYDYTLGELMDSLGLTMPTTPNLDGMGGGQGIIIKTTDGYITEQGFIPNSYIASLGDPESFINKPVIDVQIPFQEIKEATPEDISTRLSLLDIGKAVTPFALAALANEVVDTVKGDGGSGFAVVPIPSDWKSPEYNTAFTPSAPINFGSPDLLRGTQWENYQITQPNKYTLTNLVNTLNMAPVSFVQPDYQVPMTAQDLQQQFNIDSNVGVNDVIGNLNNRPVSIADIIAGIQSGQNYTS